MAIPEQFIDELVARCDIVDVVSDYLTLTQKGGSYWGLCPFHGEKTPSFHVVPDRQSYHCFGCGKGGGVLSFIMEMEHLPFPEAVRLLSKRAGLEFPEDMINDEFRKYRDRLLTLNKEAARYFHTKLYEKEGASALSYLQNRGLTKVTVTRFGLGYAPDGWDNLLSTMGHLGYEKKELLDAGLAVSGQKGKIYDRFRGRVIFPIIDLRGNVIGFGGRVLDNTAPKYLNSPDTVIFNKSQNLFALNFAKNSKFGRIILTEGYMDTISLYQAGFDCAVASLGTAFTAYHARLLSRYTKEVIIAYDSDEAGVSAAHRAIPFLEKAGLKVKVLQIQGAKDPDEYIKTYGRDGFLQLLDRSEEHMDYILSQIRHKYRLEEDAQKIEFAREAAEIISGLVSPVERNVYAIRVADIAGIDQDAVLQEVTRAYKRKMSRVQKKQERKHLLPSQQVQPKSRELKYDNLRSARAEEGILRLLLLDDTLFREVEDLSCNHFSSPFLGKIYEILSERQKMGRSIQLGALADDLTSDELSHLASILEKPEVLSSGKQALADYRAIIDREQITKAGESDEQLLLAAREQYQKTKSMGDVNHV
jgi:DNA primase